MKNIVNYLDEYLDEEGINETVIKSKRNINKDAMKAYKKCSREDEINAHGKPISYNHIFVKYSGTYFSSFSTNGDI